MPLPTPVGHQRDVLYLPASGHVVVLGTAGSGKTTLAVLRAAYLAHPGTKHQGKTLLITFNRALVAYLRHLGENALGDVVVEHYHKFARGYLASRGQMGWNDICNDDQRTSLIHAAAQDIRAEHADLPLFNEPLDSLVDEISWIARHGIRKFAEYQEAERAGHVGARVPPGPGRRVVWKIYGQYFACRRAAGKRYDWDDVAFAVCRELAQDSRPRRYRHIVIDEGQDFSPVMIRSLTLAIPANGSLTFFGDVAQQIYGHRASWRSAGLQIKEPWIFKQNYRNTQQIAQLALAIARMPYFRGVPDLVEPVAPAAAGPLPTLVWCASPAREQDLVVGQAAEAARTQSVALLFRRRADEQLLPQSFRRNAVRLHRDMSTWQAGPGVWYGTYHSAKGLEFDMVILPHLGVEHLPSSDEVAAFGEAEAAARDGRLLYVGVTRAKTRLIMTYTGEVTRLLPETENLYTRVTV